MIGEANRIPATWVRERLQSSDPPMLVCAYDDDRGTSIQIPGSITIRELRDRLGSQPTDKDIVFYCAGPHEATSARAAEEFQARGFRGAKALLGGVDAWREEMRHQKTEPKGPVPGHAASSSSWRRLQSRQSDA